MNTKSILKSNPSKTTPHSTQDQYSTIKDRKKRVAGDFAISTCSTIKEIMAADLNKLANLIRICGSRALEWVYGSISPF
jgi:hypothetical protein